MSVERASGNRRSDQPVTRRGWLIAGVVGLILVVIGVGVGIAAGIGSGGSSTCSGSALFQVAVLRMACPSNSPLAGDATKNAPTAGDYTQQMELYFHPPVPSQPTFWVLFPGPGWGECVGPRPGPPPQKQGTSTVPPGKDFFEETWSFTVINWSDINCTVLPSDARFRFYAYAPQDGQAAGAECHFHKDSGRTPTLDCEAAKLASGTSKVSVNGYDQVSLYWSADARVAGDDDDNVAKSS